MLGLDDLDFIKWEFGYFVLGFRRSWFKDGGVVELFGNRNLVLTWYLLLVVWFVVRLGERRKL